MEIYEIDLKIPLTKESNIFQYFEKSVLALVDANKIPIRFVITSSDDQNYHCELGVLEGTRSFPSIFEFQQREFQNAEDFTIVLLIPTGIGAEIGGHAGDACPVAKMFSPLCDNLILHPNVVNASDINEAPENALYVEGSIICRLLMGTLALGKVHSNRILLIIDKNVEPLIKNDYINCFNGARASYGLNGELVIEMKSPIEMTTELTGSKRASGRITKLEYLIDVLDKNREEFDALALATIIQSPLSVRKEYFEAEEEMTNPWGGVEAIFTHALSQIYNCPSAHAPMLQAQELNAFFSGEGRGVVDPRKAAELISNTCLQCVLKGLQRSPRIFTPAQAKGQKGSLGVEDISCLVIPDGCLSLPIYAALTQGITVIAVKENRNLMRNDLTKLPWKKGQFFQVENYWEAAGVIASIRGGICPRSVRRPINKATVITQ